MRRLSLAGLALLSMSAQASVLFSYHNNDVLLGIQTNGTGFNGTVGDATRTLVIDLTTFGSSGSIATDMSSTFGSGWNNNSGYTNFSYGIVGGIASASATTVETGYSIVTGNGATTNSVKLNLGATTVSSTYASYINDVANALSVTLNSSIDTTTINTAAGWQDVSTANSWGPFTVDGANSPTVTVNFDAFSSSTWETTFGKNLNLWQLADNNVVTKVGSVSLSSVGALTYTAVPEPKETALLFLAAGVMAMMVKMRRKKA